MDNEQARFILRSFRPDGADVNDQDFAAALALATTNRELGEWLARERAFDASFAQALASIELPTRLRDDILGCLHGERGDFPEANDSDDSLMIGALASLKTPPTLRGDILAAMERSVRDQQRKVLPFWKKLGVPLAAAAGIAMAFMMTHPSNNPSATARTGPLPADFVQASFIQTYESPLFRLEVKENDQKALLENLKSRSLPCPCCLPPGLAGVKGVGCRELLIDGKRGSLICFDSQDAGIVHLIIFRREDINADYSSIQAPIYNKKGDWAIAQWENTENVFILIGNTELNNIKKLFQTQSI